MPEMVQTQASQVKLLQHLRNFPSNFQTDQIGRGKSCMSKVDRKSVTNFQLCLQISHICSVSANLCFDLLDTVGSNVNMRVKTLHFHVKQLTHSIALEIEKRVGGTFSISRRARSENLSMWKLLPNVPPNSGKSLSLPRKKKRTEVNYHALPPYPYSQK